jgi:hypothetical protein
MLKLKLPAPNYAMGSNADAAAMQLIQQTTRKLYKRVRLLCSMRMFCSGCTVLA